MVIIEILLLFIIIIAVILTINTLEQDKSIKNFVIPIDNTHTDDFPIVVLENNGNKFNFILDTGANSCLLSSKILNKIKRKELGSAGTARGISGDQVVTNKVEATFKYENINITEIFQVFEVTSFEVLEAQYGIEIAGILGYNFLRGHEFVMDLKELITYTK